MERSAVALKSPTSFPTRGDHSLDRRDLHGTIRQQGCPADGPHYNRNAPACQRQFKRYGLGGTSRMTGKTRYRNRRCPDELQYMTGSPIVSPISQQMHPRIDNTRTTPTTSQKSKHQPPLRAAGLPIVTLAYGWSLYWFIKNAPAVVSRRRDHCPAGN